MKIANPLSGLFAGIAGALLWLALDGGTGPLRNGLIVIAALFAAVAALLLVNALLVRRFLNAYHAIANSG